MELLIFNELKDKERINYYSRLYVVAGLFSNLKIYIFEVGSDS